MIRPPYHRDATLYRAGRERAADWRDDALCADAVTRGVLDPELFFPRGTTGAALLEAEDAKRVCYSCPVIQDCLTFGMGQEFGIWGGMSELDRKRAKRKRQRERLGDDVATRDAAIWERHEAGASSAQIGLEFGLTPQAVGLIVRTQEAAADPAGAPHPA